MGVDLTGVINFYSHTTDGSPPYMDVRPTLLNWPKTNYVPIPTSVPIYDLHGRENDFHLDRNGFEWHQYVGDMHNAFDDNSEEQQSAYEDIQNILKIRLDASRVIVFWHLIRSRGTPFPVEQCNSTHKNPFYYPHVDCNPAAAKSKVVEVLGEDEGRKVMKNHFQIVNIWKPLKPNPIVNHPLAICDYQSVDTKTDLHLTEIVASENTAGLYVLSKNVKDTQKWYYLSNMTSNEMFMIKIFDSDPNVAQFGVHTAFTNTNAPSPGTEQYSVEFRCLVFYDE